MRTAIILVAGLIVASTAPVADAKEPAVVRSVKNRLSRYYQRLVEAEKIASGGIVPEHMRSPLRFGKVSATDDGFVVPMFLHNGSGPYIRRVGVDRNGNFLSESVYARTQIDVAIFGGRRGDRYPISSGVTNQALLVLEQANQDPTHPLNRVAPLPRKR
jgi:hypothetical protein